MLVRLYIAGSSVYSVDMDPIVYGYHGWAKIDAEIVVTAIGASGKFSGVYQSASYYDTGVESIGSWVDAIDDYSIDTTSSNDIEMTVSVATGTPTTTLNYFRVDIS